MGENASLSHDGFLLAQKVPVEFTSSKATLVQEFGQDHIGKLIKAN
jgi:hypothetical protein